MQAADAGVIGEGICGNHEGILMVKKFPDFITISVDYYNLEEKRNLSDYFAAKEIAKIVSEPLVIPTAEFLTYYLFDRQRDNQKVYPNYRTIRKKIGSALNEIEGFIVFNSQSICLDPTRTRSRKHVTQFVAESIGLSVVGRFHGLIESDWIAIPEGGKKTFDYEIASTGKEIIQVEAKGSAVKDNQNPDDKKVKKQKALLDIKKKKLEELKGEDNDPHPADIRYGTITAIDPREEGLIKCWLTDPDSEPIKYTPERLRLFARLKFLRDMIILISPRSQFPSALNTRIGCLEHIRDVLELNEIPLKRVNGDLFDFSLNSLTDQNTSFFANKSKIINGSGGGITLKISEKTFFFLGIQEELLTIAAKQNFELITKQKFEAMTQDDEVDCYFDLDNFKRLGSDILLSIKPTIFKHHVRFNLKGQLHYSSSGIIFGLLTVPE